MPAWVQAAADAPPDSNVELKYFSQRMSDITRHFPSALNMDDFLARVEVALCAHGFRGDNSITCTNLCRDESTGILKSEIDDIFGASFNINGLGACLTCGQLGTLLVADFSRSRLRWTRPQCNWSCARSC